MNESSSSGNAAAQDEPGAAPGPRVFTMLENNPDVMNELARRLGLTDTLAFHDVYSLYDADVMAMVPRPVSALLVTIPMNPAWKQDREAEDARLDWYEGSGPNEPVTWFQQTVIHGCGLIGFIHCAANGLPADAILPGSKLAKVLERATPLSREERAALLHQVDDIHEASEAVARMGDSRVLDPYTEDTPHHFIALVKGRDGNLWELEGGRKGPINRGSLADDEDAFSERALNLGMRRLIDIQGSCGSDLPFSCIALGPKAE